MITDDHGTQATLDKQINDSQHLPGRRFITSPEGATAPGVQHIGSLFCFLRARVEMNPNQAADYEQVFEQVQVRLGEEGFAAAWAQGRAMSPEEAFAGAEQQALPAAALAASTRRFQRIPMISPPAKWKCCGCWPRAGLMRRLPGT